MISAVGLVQWSASGPMRVSSCYERSLVGLHLRAPADPLQLGLQILEVFGDQCYRLYRRRVVLPVTDDGRGKPDLAERPHIGPGRGLIQFP